METTNNQSHEQLLQNLDEAYSQYTLAQVQSKEAAMTASNKLAMFTTMCVTAVDAGVGLEAIANKLGVSRPTITTYELIGRGLALPMGESKNVVKQGLSTTLGSPEHVRWSINEALSRSVKVGGKSIRCGWSVGEIRTFSQSVADRESFLSALSKRTPRHAALIDAKKQAAEDERLASATRASVLSEVVEMLDGLVDLPAGDNDSILVAKIIALLGDIAPNEES